MDKSHRYGKFFLQKTNTSRRTALAMENLEREVEKQIVKKRLKWKKKKKFSFSKHKTNFVEKKYIHSKG